MIDRRRALPIWPTSSFPTAGTTARSRSNSRPGWSATGSASGGPGDPCGETFDRVTEKALEEARAVVVLWSRRSVESTGYARRQRRREPRVACAGDDRACRRPVIFELVHTADLAGWSAMPPIPVANIHRRPAAHHRRGRQDPALAQQRPVAAAQVAKARAVELPSGSGRVARGRSLAYWALFPRNGSVEPRGNSLHTGVSVAQNGVTLAVLPFANLSADPARTISPTALPRRSSIGWRGFRRCG